MPLYLVRWAHLRASLIRADNEDELKWTIDQVGDYGQCKWWRYTGPVWVDFDLPVEFIPKFRDDDVPLAPDEFELGKVEEYASNLTGMQLGIERCCETVGEMQAAIIRKAFPHLWKIYDASIEDDMITEDVPALRAALHRELDLLVKYEALLREVRDRTDPEAKVMQFLGTSKPLP